MSFIPMHYLWEAPPPSEEPREVAPGLFWLRFPLPFALNHVNLWALSGQDGWTIVDCCVDTKLVRELWGHILEKPLFGKPVRRILVTHYHPDHAGAGKWLVESHDAELLMPREEWLLSRNLSLDVDFNFRPASEKFYRATSTPQHLAQALLDSGNRYAMAVPPLPAPFTPLIHGREIDLGGETWRVMISGGHAPAHAALYSRARNILISGDAVLPKITPNISVWGLAPDENNLELFFRGLDLFRNLPEDVTVLPSHGLPFKGLWPRLSYLREHHEERLTFLEGLCAEAPQTTYDMLVKLFPRSLDNHQYLFALGETVAHLNYLLAEKRLSRRMDETGAWRYTA